MQTKMGDVTFCDWSQTFFQRTFVLNAKVSPGSSGFSQFKRNNWNSTHRNDFEASDRGSDVLIEAYIFFTGAGCTDHYVHSKTQRLEDKFDHLNLRSSVKILKRLKRWECPTSHFFLIYLNSALTWSPSSLLTWPRIRTELYPTLKVRYAGRSLKKSKKRIILPFFWAKLS